MLCGACVTLTAVLAKIVCSRRKRSMEFAHHKAVDAYRALHSFQRCEARAAELEGVVDALHALHPTARLAPQTVILTLEERIASLREGAPRPPTLHLQELLRSPSATDDATQPW